MKAQLSPAQQAEADALFLELKGQGDDLLREIAALFASKPEAQMLGQTEFDLRDLLHRFGAEALAAALEERRKKKGTAPTPSSSRRPKKTT